MSKRRIPVIASGREPNEDNYAVARVEVVLYGERAIFRNPMFKVEGMTYPCITGSAARGALEAIFWHPQYFYSPVSIEILKPINTEVITVNEPNFFERGKNVIRNYITLTDVAYRIVADINIRKGVEVGVECNAIKYRNIFNQRVKKGQCYKTPFLGISEYHAFFRPCDSKTDKPHLTNFHIGNMLLDIQYGNPVTPRFMNNAAIKSGVLLNGDKTIEETYRLEMAHLWKETYHE